LRVVEESKVGIFLECAMDFFEPERMKEVVVIEESDDGTSRGSNAVGDHRAQTGFTAKNPRSLTIPDLAFEVVVVEIRDNDQFKRQSDGRLDRGEGPSEELAAMPGGDDD
jgi:hypothetical protein